MAFPSRSRPTMSACRGWSAVIWKAFVDPETAASAMRSGTTATSTATVTAIKATATMRTTAATASTRARDHRSETAPAIGPMTRLGTVRTAKESAARRIEPVSSRTNHPIASRSIDTPRPNRTAPIQVVRKTGSSNDAKIPGRSAGEAGSRPSIVTGAPLGSRRSATRSRGSSRAASRDCAGRDGCLVRPIVARSLGECTRTVTAAGPIERMAVGVDGVRWCPRSSKPLWGCVAVLGGFDSHALPPATQVQIGLRIACRLDGQLLRTLAIGDGLGTGIRGRAALYVLCPRLADRRRA